MNCLICSKPTLPRCSYDPRCRKLVTSRHADLLKRRTALQKSYSKADDSFHCHYTGAKLEEKATSSPWYIVFDHIIPIPSSALAATGAVINEAKGDLTDEEFKTANIQLRKRKNGGVFDKASIKFQYWSRVAEPPQLMLGGELLMGEKPTENCIICGKPSFKGSVYCPRCRRFTQGGKDCLARRAAMKASYDKEADGFRCQYTGILLDDQNGKSPWYVSFDHKCPVRKADPANPPAQEPSGGPAGPSTSPAKPSQMPARGPPSSQGRSKRAQLAPAAPSPAPSSRIWPQPNSGEEDRATMARRSSDSLTNYKACGPLAPRSRAEPEDPALVVSALWVTIMKEEMSRDEFQAFYMALGAHFENGAEYDPKALKFDYWRKKTNQYGRAMPKRKGPARARGGR